MVLPVPAETIYWSILEFNSDYQKIYLMFIFHVFDLTFESFNF